GSTKDDDDNVDNEDDDGQDDVNDQTKSNNDGDDFVHPKFSTHDEEDKEEEGSDLRVQTPSHFESTEDESYDEVTQGDNVEGEEMDEEETNEEETNEEEEVNELYMDVNVNLERRDTKMTDALYTNVQGTQVIEDTHVIITAVTPKVQQQSSFVSPGFISNMRNPNPDTSIDSILNLNTESTSLVDVPVTTNAEMPPSSVTTLPLPPIPLIQPLQQTPVSLPTIVPSTSLQNLSTFAVSSIPGIVDKYLANQMNEAVKAAVQLQSDRLRDEAQAENEDFINKIDENIRKIIKEQVKIQVKEQVSKILPRIEKSVNEQLESEVLTRSSSEAKTSHAVAANLSELELKKILIDKMENNKSIDRSVQKKNLYKALLMLIKLTKVILESYADTVTFKRRRDDEDEPSAGSNRGFKKRRAGKEPESTSAPKEKISMSTGKSKEGSKSHQKSTGNTLARNEDPCESFNELMDTPLDFSAFVLNRLKVDTLTPELLVGLTFELMKGSCKSLVELEYFLKEVCKYSHDLRKPLQLIPNSRGRRVIPFDHFINNDLAYISSGVSSRTYATLVTKTKAADYGHIKWIEDLVPNTIWSQVPIVYDKHAL
ncbi:hypothetical protein Tco_1453846, partial [Tanacetum coccineum]